jgi:rRNA maturation RNase YbeY
LKYLPKQRVRETVRIALEGEDFTNGDVNVIYMDDSEIRILNDEYLGHDYATDVLSFTIEEKPLLGEIYIGVETARRQACEYEVSLSNEILRLAAHGALHLAGYEDDTPEKREQMRRLEDKYIEYQT